jgi:protein-S-isoprenylcysteine O-methyltransferase Ste14
VNGFHLIFVISLFTLLILRIYYGRKARRGRGAVEVKESRLNIAFRAFFGLGYVAAMLVYAFSPGWFAWAALPFPNWLRGLGALITVASLLLLWWVQWALDVQFDTTLHTQANHELIQHGPYRWVRHPMYTTLFLLGLGWFLLTANWLMGIPLMIGIGFVVISRVEQEEQVLVDLFGDPYQEYVQKTGRFLPRFFTRR